MIKSGFALVLLLGICASSPAQTFRDTLPDGMLNRGGDWDNGKGSPFVFWYADLRYQEAQPS